MCVMKNNVVLTTQKMAKRHAYEAQFKLTAINYAEEHGNRAAAREFKISESMVRKWRKLKTKLRQVKKTRLSFRGNKARWPELEERLEQWIIEQRTSGKRVTTVTIRQKAVTLAEEMKIEHFKGGPSWCFRFMKRFSIHARTKSCPTDTWIKSLDEKDFEEMTDDSSATMDEQFFTMVKQNLPSRTSDAAKPDSVEERQDQQKRIKTETPSDEDEEDDQLKMCCREISTSQYSGQSRAAAEIDLTLRTEAVFQPIPSPVSNPPSVPLDQNRTHVPTELQRMSNIRTTQTSVAVHTAEASAGASAASQEETMDLEQLKREKLQMQLRVLKLQEEYYSLKLNEIKRTKK